jgi:hypothetical protein
MAQSSREPRRTAGARYFVGGSDARIIMGKDEAALLGLWREKRARPSQRTSLATSSSSLGQSRKS